jgi:hypothetical protein
MPINGLFNDLEFRRNGVNDEVGMRCRRIGVFRNGRLSASAAFRTNQGNSSLAGHFAQMGQLSALTLSYLCSWGIELRLQASGCTDWRGAWTTVAATGAQLAWRCRPDPLGHSPGRSRPRQRKIHCKQTGYQPAKQRRPLHWKVEAHRKMRIVQMKLRERLRTWFPPK